VWLQHSIMRQSLLQQSVKGRVIVRFQRCRWTFTTSEVERRAIQPIGGWNLGIRARLLFAFFGISGFSILAAAAGIYAFRQVGDRLELIDVRVPQVVSSMEISRAADRLIASAPAMLAATTTKQRDEVTYRIRPEVDRLNTGLNDVGRTGTASEAATAIQLLVASFRSNLAELENLVGLRVKTRERLAGLLQAVFQANQEAIPRAVQAAGRILCRPILGGLHHQYGRT